MGFSFNIGEMLWGAPGVGGSKSESLAQSRPLAAKPRELANTWRIMLESLGPGPKGDFPPYKPPADYRWLTGDWNKFQTALEDQAIRPLQEDMQTAEARELARLRTIGMSDDPAASKLIAETIRTPYTRAMGDATNAAIAQRYGMEQGALDQYNTAMMARAALENEYGVQQYGAPREYWLNQLQNWYTPSTAQISSTRSRGDQTRGITQGLTDVGEFIANIYGKSSRRYKSDIEPLSVSTNDVTALRPVSFTWIEDERKAAGLIAEEVEEIMPDAVLKDPDGQAIGIDYASIIARMIGVMQDQQKEIEALKKEV